MDVPFILCILLTLIGCSRKNSFDANEDKEDSKED